MLTLFLGDVKRVSKRVLFNTHLILDPFSSFAPPPSKNLLKRLWVPYLTDCINAAINNCCFPNELKVADVSPCYKKSLKTEKSNYRPMSVLPAISKIFERLVGSQINQFLDNKWSNLLTAVRKGHSTQDALLRVIESWCKCFDATGIIGTVLMDLSKAYDCIVHDLLIAKLEAYGVDRDSFKFVYSYSGVFTGVQGGHGPQKFSWPLHWPLAFLRRCFDYF